MMTTERAQIIAAQFKTATGYTVAAKEHGLLVRQGKQTSFFQHEGTFFRFIDFVVAKVHPIPLAAD